jgi:nitroreductase
VDLFEIIARRRSCRRFSPRPVEFDKVLQCIQAGALAPSSGNIQNWGFITVTDVDIIRNLYHHTLEQEPFLSAMSAIIVVGDTDHAHTMYGMRGKRLYTIQNCAAATENILLVAEALGLGAIWIGAFDEDKVCEIFGIPNGKFRPQAIVLLGYSAYEPEPRNVRNLDSITYYNKFGNRVKRPHLMYFDWSTEWLKLKKKVRDHTAWIRDEVGKKGGKGGAPPQGEDAQAAEQHAGPQDDSRFKDLKEMHEKSKASVQQARSKIRDVISNLKKDEYREK